MSFDSGDDNDGGPRVADLSLPEELASLAPGSGEFEQRYLEAVRTAEPTSQSGSEDIVEGFGGLLEADIGEQDHLEELLGEDAVVPDDLVGTRAAEFGPQVTNPAAVRSFPTSFFSHTHTSDTETGSREDDSTTVGTMVNPVALQLVGNGVEDDHYLPDGRHLRWTFAPELGFPRSGFRLYRRPSPSKITPKEVLAVRRSFRFASNLAAGSIRTPNGLDVSHPDGVTLEPYGDEHEGVALDETPTRIRFAESDERDAPALSTCWVSIDFARRRHTGAIAAAAFGEDGTDEWIQDRGGVGEDLQDYLEPLGVSEQSLEDIRTKQGVQVLEPDASGSTLVTERGERDDGGDVIGGFSLWTFLYILRRIIWLIRTEGLAGLSLRAILTPLWNPWETGKLVLHGSVIDELQVTGTDAVIRGVNWLPVADYAQTEGWEEVETFRLPIRGDGTFYPQASQSGESIARDRLHSAPPKALPPWDEPTWPPSPDPAGVETDQQLRYLGAGHQRLEDALDTILETEMTDAVSQASVTREATLTPDASTTDELRDSETEVGLLDSVLTVAVDPQQATALGLATTEADRLEDRFDYKLEADWPLIWWLASIAPGPATRLLEAYRDRQPDADGVVLPIWGTETDTSPTALEALADLEVNSVSVVTDVQATRAPPVDPPTGLTAEITPKPGESIPASVTLNWNAEEGNLYTAGGHVAYAVRRRYEGTDEALHRDDPESEVTLPHVNASDGPVSVTDHDPPGLGTVTYRVSGMDIWGRFSDFAEVTVEVTDEAAPPTPSGLSADLHGDPDDTSWSLEVAFDWTAGQRNLAPDTASFEILCEQGNVEVSTAGGNRGFTGWDRAELAPGTRERIQIAWPSLSVTSGHQGVTAWVEPQGAAGDPTVDARVHVTVPDVIVPYDGDEAELSVTVVAADDRGNPSSTMTPDTDDVARRVVASRVAPREPVAPSLPSGPQRTTWPDAQGQCHWTCSWTGQPSGSQTKVLRASQARLLSAAGVAHEDFAGKSPGDRAEQLRQLAANNQGVFSPDHQEPYDAGTTEHTVTLGGDDRGWTVVTARHTGPTGTRSPWPGPDGFAVVAPKTAQTPPTPRLSASPATDSVELEIAPDPSGATKAVRLYRTPDPDAAEDLRRMRPLAFPSTPGDPADVPVQETQSTTVTDDVPYADRWYAYRAVAESPSEAQSSPTEPVWVRAGSSTPPPTPTVVTVETVPNEARKRRVEIEVEGYGLDLWLRRARAGTGDWTTLEKQSVQELSTVSTSAGTRTVEVIDEVPASAASWAYTYEATVEDRRGRTATSNATTQGGSP